MEIAFRAALLARLHADPVLAAGLNSVAEEAPLRAAPPWLASSPAPAPTGAPRAATGREVRVALELQCLGDDPGNRGGRYDRRDRGPDRGVAAGQAGFRVASLTFLRARAEQRGESRRAVLLEYRARLLAN